MIKRNIANILTFSRIIASLLMIKAKLPSVLFFVFYIYAGLSDALDGFIARKLNITSEFGRKLDSVSDLLFYTVMMIKILPYLFKLLPSYMMMAIWCVLAIRVLMYLYVYIRKHSLLSNHTILNKLTGFLLFLLPFVLGSKIFVSYSGFVITVSFVAALYEVVLLFKNVEK